MKRIIQTSILLFTIIVCKAQSPIIPLNNSGYGDVTGGYYKDTENFLDQFEGTWLYSSNGTILKIILKKKEMFYVNGGPLNFYTDYIVGEYQYIKNNLEVQNTLDNINMNYQEISYYNIYGNIQKRGIKFPASCPECQPGELRLMTFYTEPSRRDVEGLDSEMVFRRFTENGVTKLKIWFYGVSGSYGFTRDGQPTDIVSYLLPYGEYVLTKQL
ncbi:DUF6705 family protein [Flavobacterium microcysteis]|uniref:DUF6705 domain-containing protein n=1 Tax=Flavobacterium microcysteis TaxID=2596891 RepID=A0A501Q2S4_9FLAO|nr:DUF6705 family protein [Flavobacterium microcysteis]TPD67180.1 hypothetical protein FJA49_12935 [Flavobacterium microcysteis]